MPDPRYLNDPEEESEPWTEPIEAEDDQSAQETCQVASLQFKIQNSKFKIQNSKLNTPRINPGA